MLERIGEGASAIVYKARRDDDGTLAALKVAKRGLDDEDGWVGREAALVASLERRWGPRLLDAGRVPSSVAALPTNTSFVATTWIEGESLDGVVARTTSERSALAARVAHGVGRALDELHGMGVRHGDVKLSNVVVAPGTPESRDACDARAVTLIDMGLAASLDNEHALGSTPRYLAPEIAAGDAATPAADLYALGIVLAEILMPTIATAGDPRPLLAPTFGEGEIGRWIEALVARSPGARPAASWVADRAARFLGLASDEREIIEARKARVRRTYLAVRAEGIRSGGTIDEAIASPTRDWLEEALALAARVSEPDRSEALRLEPLDTLGKARWLLGLVGPQAASWPSPAQSEGELASQLLSLCEVAAPEAWTLADVVEGASGSARAAASWSSGEELDLALTRALLRPRPDAAAVARAESEVADGRAPTSLAVDLAMALLRRGEIGRAFAAISAAKGQTPEVLAVFSEIARRRGDVVAAEGAARRAAADASAPSRDGARAILARLAWDRGAFDVADEELGDARGASAAEVRGLVAYARGDLDRGLRIVDDASREPNDALGQARLAATRGMLEHARGHAAASVEAFASAADLAAREGAVVEEATYLTGLAAAATDAGAASQALGAATRAALLWERLGRPALAARAFLSRAAAFAIIGASHDADVAAALASSRAKLSGDRRAVAFARWSIVETRLPRDARARREVLLADEELARLDSDPLGEDRVRSAARLLVWADGVMFDGSPVRLGAIDERVGTLSGPARWDWWGARATALVARRKTDGAFSVADAKFVIGQLLGLLDQPAPVGARGPALDAGVRLAAEIPDGDVVRRLETARRAAADALRAGTPVEHRAALATVAWAHASSSESAASLASAPLGAAQVEQLDAIVRSLSSRDRLKPLLEQVLDAMVLWTGVERGLLLLTAPDGKLVPRAARNLARRDLGTEQLTLSMGIAKRAMDERQAVVATDAYSQIGDLHASVHALRLRSVLAVPLVARGDVLGVVYLDDRVRRGAFGPAELAWVRLVASQAALAIADARDQALLRRAIRRAERANASLARELGAREAELVAIRAELAQGEDTRFRYDEIAGRSEPMRAMLRLVDRVTASDVPVLLIGESGTGKELVARAIHTNGPRASRPFVTENCGSVPEALLESTLFGHVRGAFTGASSTRAGLFDVADGGTLFLDEIGEMPLAMQTKLLRVLQNGEVRPVGSERVHKVDVRIIGATHRDLEAMVAAGTFREDLFYRLNVVSIRVPALRERQADIPLLVAHFIEKHAKGRRLKVTKAAIERLTAFAWPGNVRQLENEIRRALVLADERIDEGDLSEEVARGGPAAAREAGSGLKARVDALETQLVREALVRTKGNQTRAAEALGISRFGLQKMMRRLGIR
ncbi:Response regulator of zinc sigma-54-dependent two-component system [Labilithrix luteola]|uniref:Response regulator of zinc sigma-54-dependent two-component system n=1 Tax=Labilithrix luteola TaxID=1391654 RepID=A0A0K1PZM8_9BACT|nr:Response regulator of zinc sigma-54-dependent two-component system [Labilithrix luteola]